MAQTVLLIDTLKQALKSHGLTYRDVATALGLSEASVKRLFAGNKLSLQRLDQICQLMGMEITDLTAMLSARHPKTEALSIAQEQEIADDVVLLLVAICVLNKFTFDEIREHYAITKTELIRKLAHLDRLKIIELFGKGPEMRVHPPHTALRKRPARLAS